MVENAPPRTVNSKIFRGMYPSRIFRSGLWSNPLYNKSGIIDKKNYKKKKTEKTLEYLKNKIVSIRVD